MVGHTRHAMLIRWMNGPGVQPATCVELKSTMNVSCVCVNKCNILILSCVIMYTVYIYIYYIYIYIFYIYIYTYYIFIYIYIYYIIYIYIYIILYIYICIDIIVLLHVCVVDVATSFQRLVKKVRVSEVTKKTGLGGNASGAQGQRNSHQFTTLEQIEENSLVYPLVIQHNYGKSPFLMGKSTINGHFQ